MRIATVGQRKYTRTFDFDGEPVTIDIQAHKITPEYRSKLAALARKTDETDGEASEEENEQDAKMVADLVSGWDIEWSDEEPDFPPTYENLLRVPCTLLGRIASEIMEVIKEFSNPTRRKKSSR